MKYSYSEMYVENAMIVLGDMLEYACLDCGYDPDSFWKMFIMSGMARRFEIGDCSIIVGKSGPEVAQIVMERIDHVDNYETPTWRESRSDIFWAGWIMAYFQWHENMPFEAIWDSITIRMLLKMYGTLHEADISKSVDVMRELIKPADKTSIRILRLTRGMTQKELAEKSAMTLSQVQRLEYGERKAENLELRTAIALANALGVSVNRMR